ncbi:MAG: hypothetical protein AAGF26_11805 [Cyanobacteria bacterium P01_G01_bin.49]
MGLYLPFWQFDFTLTPLVASDKMIRSNLGKDLSQQVTIALGFN